MTQPPTSYPYLTVAKAYGVDYWRVLKFADLLDERPPNPGDWYLPKVWMVATCLAWRQERERRFDITPADLGIGGGDQSVEPVAWDPDPFCRR